MKNIIKPSGVILTDEEVKIGSVLHTPHQIQSDRATEPHEEGSMRRDNQEQVDIPSHDDMNDDHSVEITASDVKHTADDNLVSSSDDGNTTKNDSPEYNISNHQDDNTNHENTHEIQELHEHITDKPVSTSIAQDELKDYKHTIEELQKKLQLSEDENHSLATELSKINEKLNNAQTQYEALKAQNNNEIHALRTQAESEIEHIKASARKEGYDEGKDQGYIQGKEDVDYVVGRLRIICGAVLTKRHAVLQEAESGIIDIILLIAKKVVKNITREQKNIVVDNVRAALSKINKSSQLTIRINPQDFRVNEEALRVLVHDIEKDGNINFFEDGTIESGGVLIETDYGQVDARIGSQLLEIENSILSLK